MRWGDGSAPAGSAPQISHAALLVAAQIVRWSLRLASVGMVARALGPEKFGVYALLFAVTEFLAAASGAGYTDYLTRETAKDAHAGWALAGQLVPQRIAIAVAAAAPAMGILRLMHFPKFVLAAAAWMTLTLIPRSLSEGVQGVLRGMHEYRGFLAVEFFSGASLVAGAGILLAIRGGVRGAVAVEIAAACSAALAAGACARKCGAALRFRLGGFRSLKQSAAFNAYSLVGNLSDRFDVVLLSRLAGDYATGIYSVAYRALSMTQVIGYGVFYSLLPALSRDVRGGDERRRLERAAGVLLSFSFVVVLVTTIFAEPAVRFFLGARYAEAAAALKILIWAVIVRYLNCALNIGLLAGGQESLFVAISLICLSVNFAGNLFLIPRYGWRAAAFLTIVTELVLLAQNLYWIRRIAGKIALPTEAARTSLAFGAAVAATVVGGRVGRPMVVGCGCLVLFVFYLYFTGAWREFAAVWEFRRDAPVQAFD